MRQNDVRVYEYNLRGTTTAIFGLNSVRHFGLKSWNSWCCNLFFLLLSLIKTLLLLLLLLFMMTVMQLPCASEQSIRYSSRLLFIWAV